MVHGSPVAGAPVQTYTEPSNVVFLCSSSTSPSGWLPRVRTLGRGDRSDFCAVARAILAASPACRARNKVASVSTFHAAIRWHRICTHEFTADSLSHPEQSQTTVGRGSSQMKHAALCRLSRIDFERNRRPFASSDDDLLREMPHCGDGWSGVLRAGDECTGWFLRSARVIQE